MIFFILSLHQLNNIANTSAIETQLTKQIRMVKDPY